MAALSKLGFQSADKEVAAVLVELHNRHVFEAGLIERLGREVFVVLGSEWNIKITKPADMELAKFYLEREKAAAADGAGAGSGSGKGRAAK